MADETSPMLAQYRRVKREHAGDVLFFRLGDFYEMFAEDAVEVSALLNLTLTHRNGLPMCGVPYHAARSYIARLLKHGKKVAICEQVGGQAAGKGKTLIERKVVEVISPGTTVDEEFLDKGSANYLAAVFGTGERLAFAYIDLSTGEFRASSFGLDDAASRLRQELERLDIREIVVQEALLRENTAIARAVDERSGIVVNRWADWLFDAEGSAKRLRLQFGEEGFAQLCPDGTGASVNPALVAAGTLLLYLDETAKSRIPHVRRLRMDSEGEYVWIDEASRRNLELLRNLRDGSERFSLLETLDETKTAMGRRLLKRRIAHPLTSEAMIERRLDMADAFYRDQKTLSAMRVLLGAIPDFERLSSRVAMGKAHGKDMLALKNALAAFEGCSALLAERRKGGAAPLRFEAEEAASFKSSALSRLLALKERLEAGIRDDPSILLTEGRLIRDGFDAELDRLRHLKEEGRGLLEAYLEEERRETGIANLRIRYNRLLGYYFEVSIKDAGRVPARFIKRQGLVSGERFTTDRLAALESDINGASDRIIALERELFIGLRNEAAEALGEIGAAAKLVAELDVAQSLARAASARMWTRPQVNTSARLHIIEGRHPVVEANLQANEFIPNDVILEAPGHQCLSPAPSGANGGTSAFIPPFEATAGLEGGHQCLSPAPSGANGGTSAFIPPFEATAGAAVPDADGSAPASAQVSFALITGPNMAGKSTYLRQAALITLMAQMGSFVPARKAEIGLADRIYCRVGASDNLARGESTFLSEMLETAAILNSATGRSLVIMDEVGRGTGTRDGLAIARAVSECLLERIRCRTLFATHYHELAQLSHPRLANRSLLVDETGGEIVFRRRLVEGAAAESYGLHVAGLAGLPADVLRRAAEIMDTLQSGEGTAIAPTVPPAPPPQQEDDSAARAVLKELADFDINTASPLDALNRISEWKHILASSASNQTDSNEPSLFE